MWWVNQHTQDMSGPKLKYLANEVDADIVLLGTSRCNFHYVPSILSDSIGMSVYNGGIDASNCIYAHYFVLNQILLHHTPKIICLELMTSDYAVSANSFETTSFLLLISEEAKKLTLYFEKLAIIGTIVFAIFIATMPKQYLIWVGYS